MNGPRDDFLLYPAIDLVAGRAVRLLHGQFDQILTNELDDALERARRVWEAGSRALHVIDLDAARSGEPAEPNRGLVRAIAAAKPPTGLLQVGGGLRSAAAVDRLIADGVDRVLIGTMAFREPELLDALIAHHGAAIAVAIDSRGGSVRIAGWQEDAGVPVAEAARELVDRGVRHLLVTGIDRDGSLAGPDLALLEGVLAAVAGGRAGVIAAGGVTTAGDVRNARALGCAGAVVGRALLDDPDLLAELLAAAA
ncbi:MAG: 1-(5-phosphoribosyl)-5-[(5-phosphoribosylamino)methylideneamino] imidazole-4-carboxamide isomerase [Actinobacteria bacterium]|nr:1-(5-phosphoribosyl)-5-[(5-phosphoribosylamino)methylideneamino] imidazole-4-carboxamide isomerase [Actinomycetota bacterium]